MSKVIVNQLGEDQLAAVVPDGGVLFFKTYFKAAENEKNMFSDALTDYILNEL